MPRQYSNRTDKTWSETYQDLARCFRSWGIHEWNVSANVPSAKYGSYYLSDIDRAVTVAFNKGGRLVELSLATQDRPLDNLRAIYLTIDDMRMIERRGLADVAQSAYLQLAAPEATRDPYEVLGVRPGVPIEVLEGAYRALAKTRHPDAGGTAEAMAELNTAYEAIKQREGF